MKAKSTALLLIATLLATCTVGSRAYFWSVGVDVGRMLEVVSTLTTSEMKGRKSGTEGAVRAQSYLVSQFQRASLSPYLHDGFLHHFKLPEYASWGANVIGKCSGIGSTDIVIAVLAHYDHLGTDEDVLFPGADDNASGVAVLLEVANECQRAKFHHTLIFAAMDAEERGLLGTRAFVERCQHCIDRIALVVNLDMVSRAGDRGLFVAGTSQNPALRSTLAPLLSASPLKVQFGHDVATSNELDDWTLQSDHAVFASLGTPFLYFGVETHVDYHRPTDTVEKIDVQFFQETSRLVLRVLRQLDEHPLLSRLDNPSKGMGL